MKRSLARSATYLPVAFLLTFLLSAARLPFSLSPFYLAVFAASVAIGWNYIVAAVAFLSATTVCALCFSSLTLSFALQMIFATAGVGIGALIHWLRKVRYRGFYVVLFGFIGQIGTLFFLPATAVVSFLINVVLSAFFALVAVRIVGVKRSRLFLFSRTEQALAALVLFAVGAGAYCVSGRGVTPYYLLLAAALPLFSSLGSEGVMYVAAYVLGAITASGENTLALPALLAVALSLLLRAKRRIAAFSLLCSCAALYFLRMANMSPYNFILLFTGGLFCALLPEDSYRKLVVHFGKGESFAARSIVNKARLDLSGKLGYVSDALRSMSSDLTYLSSEEQIGASAYRIAASLSASLCAGCPGAKDCSRQAGGNTADLLMPTALRALENGRASIVDVSPYLSSNCKRIKQIVERLTEDVERYAEERARAASLREERGIMAAEAEGIAGVLDELKRETRRVVTFDGESSKRVVKELAAEGITAYDAMVTEDADYTGVTVTMSGSDSEEPSVARAVSRAMRLPLVTEGIGVIGAGNVSVTLTAAPCFDVLLGEAVAVKRGSEACGDTKSVTRLGVDKIMIALSDGMGSGGEANAGSSSAISLVENFYKTGVDERVILPLINRLLTLRNDGSFQTLDMCLINLRTGEADFIKLSAPESVIKRKGGHEIVEGGALPLGILREVRPVISRRKLNVGDVVVMATDGVTDTIGADGIVRVIESGRTNHPQTIAENILQDATYVSAEDDRTVVALRLYRRLDG